MNKFIKRALACFSAGLLVCALTVPSFAMTYWVNGEETGKVYVTASALNIRQTADTELERVDVVPYGTELDLIGDTEIEGWSAIYYENEIRYVCNKYITDNEEEIEEQEEVADTSTVEYSASHFRKMGVIYWGDYRWTWYSQNVLPGGGLNIPGRHVDDNGYVCDENNYICLASNDLSEGTVVSTPFGKSGKIYDSGCASGTLDVYVAW